MIGKLIKNEFKTGLHSVAGIYIAAVATLVTIIVSALSKSELMAVLSLVAALAVGLLLLVITIFSVVLNFNKTLFRDQGYLSFTLPVTSGQLLFSKAFCSFFWIALSYASFMGISFAAMLMGMHIIGEDVIAMLKMLFAQLEMLPDPGAIFSYIAFVLAQFFLLIVFLVALIFFSLTLSNTRVFQHRNMLFAIIIFSVTFIITQLISNKLKTSIPLTAVFTLEGVKFSTEISMLQSNFAFGITDIIFQVAATCIFFGLTAWLMNHKINLR